MPPCEVLYERKYITPICWMKIGEERILGSKIVQETTEKKRMIREKMKKSEDHQKSNADKRRSLEFEEGDHIFLKVTQRLRLKGPFKSRKLSPRYVGPY